MNTNCSIAETHCQQCGSTSGEDVSYGVLAENDGYSGCCNETVAIPNAAGQTSCRGLHS